MSGGRRVCPGNRWGRPPLLRLLALLGAGCLFALASAQESREARFIPPPKRRPEGFRAPPFEDRQLERHLDELAWRGGQPTPEHQAIKKQVAAEHLQRFAASFPKPQGKGAEWAAIQASNAATWSCLGPTKGVSTYSGLSNPDIDSGRIAPNGLAISPDGKTLYLASSNGGLWKTGTADGPNANGTWTWTPLTDSLPMASSTGNIPLGAVALSPSGSTLFIGSGDFAASYGKGFYRSSDGGTSWTETSKANLCGLYASDYISCILPVDETTVLAGGNAGLFRSTDGGASFGSGAVGNRVLGPNGYGDRIWSVEQVGNSSQNLVASLQITASTNTGTAWYSSDGGATWNQATISGTSPTSVANIGRITLKSNKAAGNLNVWGIAQITPGRTMFKGVFLSTDGGRNYTLVPDATSPATLFKSAGASDGDQGEYNQCLAVSPTGTSVATTKVFTGSNLGFYRSSDGGSTWTWLTGWYTWAGLPVYSHADKHAAVWSPDGSTLYVGTDGGLSVFWDPFRVTPPIRQTGNPPLTDNTFVDNRHNEGLSTHLVYHLGSTTAPNPLGSNDRVTIGLQDNSTRRRTGATLATSGQFDEAYATGDGFGTLIHKLDGDKMIASGYSANLGYSTDGGGTFHNGNTGIDLTGGAPFHTRVEPGRADATGNTAYTATSYKLHKSTNFGQSWVACGMGGFPSSYPSPYIRNFNSSSLDPNKLAIVDATHCWISADGGATWTDKGAVYAAGGVEVALSYVWFDTTNDSILYAASAYAGWGPTIQHLWRSADGGTSWQNIEGAGFPSGNGVNFGGPVHIIQNDPTNNTTLLAGTDFGIYASTNSGATWSRYGVGLPMVGVPDFYIAPDASFIRAATYGRGVWQSTGPILDPAILLQPVDTAAYIGLGTTFTVQATSALGYQWQVDSGGGFTNLVNDAVYSGATAASLSLTGITAGMNGWLYRVIVTGAAGASSPTITSSAARLTVATPPSPSIQMQPANVTVAAAGTATFSVSATAVVSYQWQVNTGAGFTNLSNGGATSGATTATLTLTGATLGMNGYQYQIVLTGSAAANPQSLTSAAATLTVVTAPAFTSQPANATIATGANATFTATVTGASSTRWQSKLGAGAWTDVADGSVYSGATTTSLSITGATSGMDGTSYRLIATGALSLTTTSSTVTLAVKDPAAITVQPVDAGSTFNHQASSIFTVTATGYGLSYQWQINTGLGWGNISDQQNYGGITTSALSIWVGPSMSGYQYRVIVTGTVGAPVTSNVATLTVICTPAISSQPGDRAIAAGANTTFSVTASSNLAYQWKVNTGSGFTNVNNVGVYSGATSATLTITGATAPMNGYVYEVQVLGCGSPAASTYSSPVTLSVGAAPGITAQPANATVAAGGNTGFSVTATAATSYQWQVNTGSGFANVSNGGVYNGATTASLSITGATLAMTGYQYQVIVGGVIAPAATSSAATLTVVTPPAITAQPGNATVTVGGNATFSVTATGTGLSYQWQVSSGGAFANLANGGVYSGATAATLTLTGATAAMSGYSYQVVVSGTVAPAATSSAATLTVNTAPAITAQPVNATVTAGGNASFSITATGTGLSYQWQVSSGGAFANLANGGVYSGATTGTLTLTGATAAMSGYTYQVVVTGTVAPAVTSSAAALTVNTAPAITAQPGNAAVSVGGNTSFTVTATGTGLSYQWQVSSGGAFSNVVNGGVYSGATSATLSLTSPGVGLSGNQYQVMVTGTVAPAVTSSPATLTVNSAPAITGQPANATVPAAGHTSFTVTATGSALSYQWQVSNGAAFANIVNGGVYSGATTSTLNITSATLGMSGYQYQVVVTGNLAPAATSSIATLTVTTAPAITAQPVNAAVAAGGSASFSVTATGTALSYQWQVSSGGPFANLTNGGVYSGATTATLNLTGATAGMNGTQYQVVVTGNIAPAVTSSAATLTVNTAPAILAQPVNALVTAGGNTSFTVTATGSALTYQWQANSGGGFVNLTNGGVTSGATTATLSITGATLGMSGTQYQVVVTGIVAPAVTSSAATLTVNTAPSITGQPASAAVTAGGNATFSVTAIGTALTYQWQASSGGAFANLTDGGVYSGATTASLSIAGATAGMSGTQYQVVVTGNVAPAVTSSTATLTVNTAPAITAQPANATVSAGGNASFTVTASGTGLSYQWQVSSGGAFANLTNGGGTSGATTATLSLTGATAGMSGTQYQVVVTGNVAPAVTSSAATLTVNTPPAITAQPANATVPAGGSASFTVTASGTGLSYQWQASSGGAFSNVTNGGLYSGATTATLGLSSAPAAMNGYQYQVVVSGAVAPAATSSAATLTVNTAPAITAQPANATVPAGGSASFAVTATGTGLSYQWQVSSGGAFSNVTNGGLYSGATTATLSLSGTTAAMSGSQYQVVVSGTVGPAVTSSAATLTVNTAPAITAQPGNATVTVGGNVTFSVTATGTGLSYQWQVSSGGAFANITNGGLYSGATTAVLSLSGATVAMSGYQYQVVVSSPAAPAATSSAATLTVNTAPAITAQPGNATVTVGGNATFSVTATGTGLSYQWQVSSGGAFSNVTNGGLYSGATTAMLSITGATAAMTGTQYRVVVTGTAGSVSSAAAGLTVSVRTQDFNGDGVVNVLDLASFFTFYAPGVPVANSPADLNGDGFVDDADLALLLAGI